MHQARSTLCYSPDPNCLKQFLAILNFKNNKMPLVDALCAWLAMVPPIALGSDTRLEIVVREGRLDVI